jgi:hypothetical protein
MGSGVSKHFYENNNNISVNKPISTTFFNPIEANEMDEI